MAFTGFHSQTWMINRTTKNVNLYPYHCSLLVCLLVYMGNFWGTCARKKEKKDLGSIWKLKHLEVCPVCPHKINCEVVEFGVAGHLERAQSSARCGENFQQKRRQQGSAHLAISHGVVEESVHIQNYIEYWVKPMGISRLAKVCKSHRRL